MNREDAHKLLGGYATGTLTDAEREALFAAALDDQELFDALMKEEALRDAIADPATKDVMLRALERAPERPWWYAWRPVAGALAMAVVVLAGVAVWRGTRGRPATEAVTIAEAPVPKPPAVIEAQPAAPAPAKSPQLEVRRQAPSTPAAEVPAAKAKDLAKETEVAGRLEGAKKDVALAVAPPPPAVAPDAAVPPPPAPQRTQQGSQNAVPGPAAQQAVQLSQQSIAVQAAPVLDRAVATSGFRASSGAAQEKVAGFADTKGGPILTWTLLRGDVEAPLDTVLNAGETVRFRAIAQVSGTLSVQDGDTILASGTAEPDRPVDLGPIPPTTHELQLVLARPNVVPIRLRFTLRYAP